LLSLSQHDLPEARTGEAIVRVELASINPADFLFIAGELPGPVRAMPGQIAGLCGVGVVETAAEMGPPAGTLVAFNALGTWADYVAVPVASLISLPSDFPRELAAQYANLITAWQMVEKCGVEPGGWLALTAGYSTVAVLALQFAVRRGIRVLSVVRTAHDEPDLVGLGAAAVIATGDGPLSDAVSEATGGNGLNGIIDCVAGPTTGDLIRQCQPFSKMQLYGSLDPGNLNIAGQDVLYRFLEIIPYNYPFSFSPPATANDFDLVRRVSEEVLNCRLFVPVGGIYPIVDFREALAGRAVAGDHGKRFLSMVEKT
jgi:NADPH:quinone reductase-like Zn-dependent oxidoreductase